MTNKKEDFLMNTEANGKRGRHRWLRVMTAAVGVTAVALAMPACLDRPIEPQQPTTKAPSLQLYQSNKIDKIDLLFVIDNSISMADKQKVLAEAVPDLVKRLVQPNCLNEKGKETDNVDKGILEQDPFQTLDTVGIGKLVKMAVEQIGRAHV